MTDQTVERLIESIPSLDQLRERLAQNLRERQLLRQIIRIAQHRERLDRGQKSETPGGKH